MPKKSDSYYFQNFIECVQCGCEVARMLEDSLIDFNMGLLQDKLDELYEIEYDAGKRKHEIVGTLVEAFTTSIECEGITLLNQSIDEVTNKIEDALIRIYISNAHTIKPEAVEFIKVTIRCCNVLREMMEKFTDFRRSKTFHGLVIKISALEKEEGRMFIDSIRKSHTEVKNPIEIITWREIYVHLEKCYNACEHVTDIVESMIVKNT